MNLIIEVIGWTGAVIILLAYFLLTHHDLTSRSRVYQWMNFVGSVFVGINAFYYRAYPSFVINVIWLFIAIYGLSRIFKRK